jgi:NAD(P)H-dependent flavin oxidoreductase YrpB (nitropropane dioxygenase family)
MALYAGQSVGLVHDIAPAREIVRSLAEQARSAIERFSVE